MLEPRAEVAYKGGMRRKKTNGAQPLSMVLDALLRGMGRPEQARLARLWQHWSMVMGAELADMAWPLGHRNGALLVGGEDAMAMQELSLMAEEILERANAFMGEAFFSTVKVSLAMGRSPLDVPLPVVRQGGTLPLGPPLSGAYLTSLPEDSPVTRCYAKFVAASRR